MLCFFCEHSPPLWSDIAYITTPIQTNNILLLPSEHDKIKSTKTKTDATSQLCKRSQSAVIVSDRYIKDEK